LHDSLPRYSGPIFSIASTPVRGPSEGLFLQVLNTMVKIKNTGSKHSMNLDLLFLSMMGTGRKINFKLIKIKLSLTFIGLIKKET
jgi:hypothetical protein